MISVCENKLRIDGRFSHELRRIRIHHSASGNRGTVTLAHGNTQVAAFLAKPRDKDKGQLCIDISFYDVARNDPVNERRLYELKTRLVDIFAQVICTENQVCIDAVVKQDDGCIMAVLINAITLCLCYNGVPLIDMCVAVCLNESLDLCGAEENKSYAVTLACLVNSEGIVFMESVGKCQKGMLMRALTDGVECCKAIASQFSGYLKNMGDSN